VSLIEIFDLASCNTFYLRNIATGIYICGCNGLLMISDQVRIGKDEIINPVNSQSYTTQAIGYVIRVTLVQRASDLISYWNF